MGFKEMVEKDIKDVFLDIEFFGEKHLIEGGEILIVIDDDKLKEKKAVAESASLFYAYAKDLPRRRTAGQSLNIDHRDYTIDDWSEDMGVATITLRENLT